jgi:hypothetical protein
MRWWLGAAGPGRDCGPAAPWTRGRAAAQLHRSSERMIVVALILLSAVTSSVGAAQSGSGGWEERSELYATVTNTGEVPISTVILIFVDKALVPLGFHRDTTSFRGSSPELGLFAFYTADGSALATITVPASRRGCVTFAALNYDAQAAGLAKAAAAAIEASFGRYFGSSVTFFSDAMCSHAL